ncbi:TPA: hypothetical protein N0F65_004881, partial [Lagenidium giganteum]
MARRRTAQSRYPQEVLQFISEYVAANPSQSTLLRVLKFELKLSRKVLERRAREAVPGEILAYQAKLQSFYSYPEQLIFIDETSKNGTDCVRRYAWAARGARAIVRTPFSRGKRVSILAACDLSGFLCWKTT